MRVAFSLLFCSLLCLMRPACGAAEPGYTVHDFVLPELGATPLGLCFGPERMLTVCTWEGDVWRHVNNKWEKFASGLMDPNGITYDAKTDSYYVAQKPEVTRLKDIDGDGVVDVYENVVDRFGYTGNYHEYNFGPVLDNDGRLYGVLNLSTDGPNVRGDHSKGPKWSYMGYPAPWRGWLYRSDRQGHFFPFASGFRSPAGINLSPQGELFVTDNQGDWMPTSALFFVREGGFYGHPASLGGRADFGVERLKDLKADDFVHLRQMPALWLPHDRLCNSPGTPVWDTTAGGFGPFQNQIFIGCQTNSLIMRCDLEWIDNQYQGFCVQFLDGLESGPLRLQFDATGALWTAQVGRGWASKGGKRGAIQRIEWDGQSQPFALHTIKLTETGFAAHFTQPLDRDAVQATPLIERWGYKYFSKYGSPEVDKQSLAATNMRLSDDGRVLFIDTDLKRERVYSFDFSQIRSAAAAALAHPVGYYTLNRLKTDATPAPHEGFRNTPKLPVSAWHVHDPMRPLPPVVTPPSWEQTVLPIADGAVVLGPDAWTNAEWQQPDSDVLYTRKGNNKTKQAFGSMRLHLEFRCGSGWKNKGVFDGNSGVFLFSNYELQVLNSHQRNIYADGSCGSLYGQQPPLVNACRPVDTWQSYDVLVKAPQFSDDGALLEPTRITAFHNGVLIHDDASFRGPTAYRKRKPYAAHASKMPLMLQHHGSDVQFRNIWLVPDVDYEAELYDFRRLFPGSQHN